MKKLFLAAGMAACLLAAPAKPVAWKVQDPPAAPVKAGARFNVKLLAAIQDGWLLYSVKPMAEGLARGLKPKPESGRIRVAEPLRTRESEHGPQTAICEASGCQPLSEEHWV